MTDTMKIVITALVACGLSAVLGRLLLPVLHALKAGASIRELGPTWHNNKTGTPIMGGLMFIFATILCSSAFWMEVRPRFRLKRILV